MVSIAWNTGSLTLVAFAVIVCTSAANSPRGENIGTLAGCDGRVGNAAEREFAGIEAMVER